MPRHLFHLFLLFLLFIQRGNSTTCSARRSPDAFPPAIPGGECGLVCGGLLLLLLLLLLLILQGIYSVQPLPHHKKARNPLPRQSVSAVANSVFWLLFASTMPCIDNLEAAYHDIIVSLCQQQCVLIVALRVRG
jgi:hypothetical protein